MLPHLSLVNEDNPPNPILAQNAPDPHVVRQNVMADVTSRDANHLRFSLFVATVFNSLQAIASVVVLSLEWNNKCDRDLQRWLLISSLRVLVRLGLR
jgi:hypothetical protein